MTCSINIHVNGLSLTVEDARQTGRSLKELAKLPRNCVLTHQSHDCDREIDDDQEIDVQSGYCFCSHAPKAGIQVIINRKPQYFEFAYQLGRDIKLAAGIELSDVLFRCGSGDEEVIPNDAKVPLHCGDHFYSSPPANYGDFSALDVGHDRFESISAANGWTFLVLPDFQISHGYSRDSTDVLVKLPPGFPDAAPDMFWVNPHLTTCTGVAPRGTSVETLLGQPWQRFSWHLEAGAWRPGISTLQDFVRCVRSRFERRD